MVNTTNIGNITINDQKFEYRYHGTQLEKMPQMSDFKIEKKDLEDYSKYNEYKSNEKQNDDKRSESFAFIFSWLISIIGSSIMCCFLYYNHSENIVYTILIGLILSVFITFILYKIIYPSKFSHVIASHLKKRIAAPSNYHKVKMYLDAKKNYDEKCKLYRKMYKYLSYDMDIISCGNKGLSRMVDDVVDYYKRKNNQIKKSNNKQYQDWWKQLDPFDFEEEVAKWFVEQGYDADVTQKSGDGGVDVIIKKGDYVGYVQCKRYNTTKVDVDVVRVLQGVVSVENATQGLVVCTLGITDQAKRFAEKANIQVITLDDLAPEDLFHPIKHKPLLDLSFSRVNKNWMRIGSLQIGTMYFQLESEAQKYINQFNKPEYTIINYGGLFYILYGDNKTIVDIRLHIRR